MERRADGFVVNFTLLKNYVMSGGTQRRALPCYHSEEMKILINNKSYPRVEIEATTVVFSTLVPLLHDGLELANKQLICLGKINLVGQIEERKIINVIDFGVLTFRLVQVLTGHGCFSKYLHQIARQEMSPVCHECDVSVDSVYLTMAEHPAWASQ